MITDRHDTFSHFVCICGPGVHAAAFDEGACGVPGLLQVHHSDGQVQGWEGARVIGLLVLQREAPGHHVATAGGP